MADRAESLHHSQYSNQSPNTLRDLVGKIWLDMSAQDGFLELSPIEPPRGWVADAQEPEDDYTLGISA